VTITYALAGSLPVCFLMLMAHGGGIRERRMVTGALITASRAVGLLSTRVYLPSSSRRRCAGAGHLFGERSAGLRRLLGALLLETHTGSRRFSSARFSVVAMAPSSR